MKINKNLVIGTAGIGGIGILVFLLRGRSASQSAAVNVSNSTPAATVPISVGGLQTAPFNITGPQTFNFPTIREAGSTAPDTSKACPCEKSCATLVSGHSSVSQDYLDSAASQVFRISSVVQKSNLRAQFPPWQYPWLYQDGKN